VHIREVNEKHRLLLQGEQQVKEEEWAASEQQARLAAERREQLARNERRQRVEETVRKELVQKVGWLPVYLIREPDVGAEDLVQIGPHRGPGPAVPAQAGAEAKAG
jgi:hypothetical protein